MNLDRSILKVTPFALVLATVVAGPAHAQEHQLFTFRSTVDHEVLVVMKGRDVQVRGSGADASFRPQLDLRTALPRTAGDVVVRVEDGRGVVEVIEQPSARNDYATVVRVRDPRAGADNYRVIAYWQPAGRDGRDDDRYDRDDRGNGRGSDHGNGRGRNDRDDDRYDRGRNDRDDDWRDRDSRGRNDEWWRTNSRNRDRGLLRWSGDVDDVSEIRISGRRVEYLTRSGAPVRHARYDLRGNGLPRKEVDVMLDVARGRGSVRVVQQPTRRNGYTAIIRVYDPRAGYGVYDFDLFW